MTNEEIEHAAYKAKGLTKLQRSVILFCSPKQTWGYRRLAEKASISYDEAQQIGWFFQASGLATIEPVRLGNEFNGSGIFLNARGELVRAEVEKLQMRKQTENSNVPNN